jgi:hypothetical protein
MSQLPTKKLVHKETGAELKIGDIVHTYSGDSCRITCFREPQKLGSTGRVYVKFSDDSFESSFFPSVIGAEFVDV